MPVSGYSETGMFFLSILSKTGLKFPAQVQFGAFFVR